MKLAIISLLALVTTGLLYLLLSGEPGGSAAMQPEIVIEDGAAEPAGDDLQAPQTEPLAAAHTEQRTAVEASPERGAQELARGLQACRVLLVEESGLKRGDLDGSIELQLQLSGEDRRVERDVEGGAFEVELKDGDQFSVSGLTLDGRRAVPDEPYVDYPKSAEVLVVRVLWAPVVRLDVLDAATGAHLSDVTLLRGEGPNVGGARHPGIDATRNVVFDSASSPLELRIEAEDRYSPDVSYFVGSPGMAWGTIHLDLTHDGQREVRLMAGGGLTIAITGVLPAGKAELRLREIGVDGVVPAVKFAARVDSRTEIDGLAPGTYRATIEMGSWYQMPLVLAEAEVVVEAGQRNLVELNVSPPPAPDTATLFGTITVPSAWEFTDFQIVAHPDDEHVARSGARHLVKRSEMESVSWSDATWAFDFGELPTGGYTIEFRSGSKHWGPLYGMHHELEPEALVGVHFEIPPPVAVEIHIVRADTGEPAGIERMHWRSDVSGVHWSGALINATLAPETDHFEFLAPSGKLRIGCFGDGFTPIDEQLELTSEHNVFRFEVERDCPLVLFFLDGETPVPPPDNWWPEFRHLEGDGEALYTAFGSSTGLEIGLSAPGRYELKIPVLPGFEPVSDQMITVVRGEPTEFIVQLVRKQ